MFLQIGTEWVRLIGDPHLGKKFNTGVPLHRRGERERNQYAEFKRQLLDTTAPDGKTVKAVILVGDLFDGFHMSNEVVEATYKIMADAAEQGLITGVEYITLMGNHDVTRNLNLTSSFDLLSLMKWSSNVRFVKQVERLLFPSVDRIILLCPYDAFRPTSEVFKDYPAPTDLGIDKYDYVIGHWDTVSFGNDHNLLPYNLTSIAKVIVTGHEHNARTFTHDQTQIIVTGSMLPYSFAEDPDEKIYVTKTLKEVLDNPQAFSDKCLKVLLEPGEELPEGIEALQLLPKYVNTEKQEETEVVMGDFDLKAIFESCFKENEVSEETTKTYWEMYSNAASA